MNHQAQPTKILARLRSLNPPRGLDERTALSIAERQATLLLELTGALAAPVPIRLLTQLPRIELARTQLPTSGVSYWTGSAWRLECNRAEPMVRQRFTLAHEFKHVIDHPLRDLLYADHGARERVADHFAACLLMPKRLVVRAWCSGEQDLTQLAELFVVSTEAMSRRLATLGLSDQRLPRPLRCSRGMRRSLRPAPAFAIAGTESIGVKR